MVKDGLRLVEVQKFGAGQTEDGEIFVQIPLSILDDLEKELVRVESALNVVATASVAGLDLMPETLIESIDLACSSLSCTRFDYVSAACALGEGVKERMEKKS